MNKQKREKFIIIATAIFLVLSFVPHVSAQQSNGIIVETQPTIAQELLHKAESSWPWYLARASGLIAAALMVVLMLSGIGFVTGTTYKFLEPITAWATHRALGIALAVMVVLHVGSLYFDTFVPFNLSDLLIPFKSGYQPMYVAFGIIALYLISLIILTSLVWLEKKPRTWKVIHIFSYLAMFLVFIHSLYLGTDLAQGVLRWSWIALAVLLLWASLVRLRRAKTI